MAGSRNDDDDFKAFGTPLEDMGELTRRRIAKNKEEEKKAAEEKAAAEKKAKDDAELQKPLSEVKDATTAVKRIFETSSLRKKIDDRTFLDSIEKLKKVLSELKSDTVRLKDIVELVTNLEAAKEDHTQTPAIIQLIEKHATKGFDFEKFKNELNAKEGLRFRGQMFSDKHHHSLSHNENEWKKYITGKTSGKHQRDIELAEIIAKNYKPDTSNVTAITQNIAILIAAKWQDQAHILAHSSSTYESKVPTQNQFKHLCNDFEDFYKLLKKIISLDINKDKKADLAKLNVSIFLKELFEQITQYQHYPQSSKLLYLNMGEMLIKFANSNTESLPSFCKQIKKLGDVCLEKAQKIQLTESLTPKPGGGKS